MPPEPLPLSNTTRRFGTVAKVFHWTIALGILLALPLGLIAERYPAEGIDLDRKILLFSLHKTLGITIFLVALARIIWALIQPRPAPLHPQRKMETFLAEVVHYLLYGALVLVPLSGWIHHAATTGFAPVFLPFGDDLFFVHKSLAVSETASRLHVISTKILIGTLALHILGALKHHFIDRDATLRRMWFGSVEGGFDAPHKALIAPLSAAVIWVTAFGVGAFAFGNHNSSVSATPGLIQSSGGSWEVLDGQLDISVTQFGATVSGTFADWSARVDFDPKITDGQAGDVTVDVAIGSLTLGSVTQQALGVGYFEADLFPSAQFSAEIFAAVDDYDAIGTLTIRDMEIETSLPFTLEMIDDVAHITGKMQVDRRDFGIGEAISDESQLAFSVVIDVTLTAKAAP